MRTDVGRSHTEAVHVQFTHAGIDGVRASGRGQGEIGRAVVGDEEHQFEQVPEGERHPRVVEQVRDRAAAGMDVAGFEFDHVRERDLAPVDPGQELDRDRNLVGRGHREALVLVEPHRAARLDVDGAHAHGAPAARGQPLDLGQKAAKARVPLGRNGLRCERDGAHEPDRKGRRGQGRPGPGRRRPLRGGPPGEVMTCPEAHRSYSLVRLSWIPLQPVR